jgi:hypothetical protein
MSSGFPLVLAVLFVTIATGAEAQTTKDRPLFPNIFEGTPEEQAACSPDSSRFCRDAEPDTFRVLACLQRNRTKISGACRKVLESHGQ